MKVEAKKEIYKGVNLMAEAVDEGAYYRVSGYIEGMGVAVYRFPREEINTLDIGKALDEALSRCREIVARVYSDRNIDDVIKKASSIIAESKGPKKEEYMKRINPDYKGADSDKIKDEIIYIMHALYNIYHKRNQLFEKVNRAGKNLWKVLSRENDASVELLEGDGGYLLTLEGRDMCVENIPIELIETVKMEHQSFRAYFRNGAIYSLSMVDPDPEQTKDMARRYDD